MLIFWRLGFLFLIIGLTNLEVAFGQMDSSSQVVGQLSNLWLQNFKNISQQKLPTDLSKIPSIWPKSGQDQSPEILRQIEQYYEQKAKSTRADYGLSWNTNVIQNFDPQPSEENLFYKAKTTTGFNWDILSGGLVANGMEAKALKNDKNIELLSALENRNQSISFLSKNKILFLFNAQKSEVLEQKKKLLQEEIAIIKKTIQLYPALNDELYKSYEQLMETNGQIQTYKGFNDGMFGLLQISTSISESWPMFDLNTKALRMLCNQHPTQDRQLMLQEENDRWRKHWINEVSLSYSFKYNYFDLRDNMNDRAFISMGLNANVPLRVFNKDYQSLSTLKLQKAKSQLQIQSDLKWTQVSTLVYEFRYKLKQYAVAVGKQDLLRQKMALYAEQSKINTEYFQPLIALETLMEYWNLEIEKLDAQQQIYLKLGDIQGLIPDENVAEYIRPWSPYEEPIAFQEEENVSIGSKGIYIWSKTIDQRSPEEIVERLMQWGIDEVYMSMGSDANQVQKYRALTQQLLLKDIEVQLLVGRNQWLNENTASKVDSLWNKLNGLEVAGVHIDIEPHAMEGYKENKEAMMSKYIQMSSQLYQWSGTKGIALTFAIPLYYDAAVLNALKNNSDEVMLMAYETSGPESIQRRAEEELNILGNKLCVALSAKDYTLRQHIERDFSTMQSWVKSQSFAIHDFESYLQLNP